MEITCITVDCDNPASVAQIWNSAHGWGGVAVHPDGTGVICGPSSGGCYLEFVRVPEGKVVKTRVHLGCSAGTLDQLDVELSRLHTLGASIAWEEDFPSEIAAVYRNVIHAPSRTVSSLSPRDGGPADPGRSTRG
jgi:glyoxalase superfamily protein